MDVLINLIAVVISQCTHISNNHVIYLKYIQFCLSIASKKKPLGNKQLVIFNMKWCMWKPLLKNKVLYTYMGLLPKKLTKLMIPISWVPNKSQFLLTDLQSFSFSSYLQPHPLLIPEPVPTSERK